MTIYVSSELWHSICIEIKDPMRKHPNSSICSSKKLVVVILQTLEVFVWKISQQWWILLRQVFSCTILTFKTDLRLGSLQGGVSGNTALRYGHYVILVTFAMFRISTPSSKPIVVHRVINSSEKLGTWSDFPPLPKNKTCFSKDVYQVL